MIAKPSSALSDQFGRPLGSLRISVTDRCNLRCQYCMPEEEYVWLPRKSILSFEEIDRLAGVFESLGVRKLRITGGEPLLRHDLADLIALLSRNRISDDLALTTNGLLLAKQAGALKAAGLRRVTVSLDTLRAGRFTRLTRSDRLADALAGIDALAQAGFEQTKLNCVVIRRFNEDELIDMIEFGRRARLEIRFIEYMDVGGATQWSLRDVVGKKEILDRISRHYGSAQPLIPEDPSATRAPADRFVLPDGTTFGIIASTTEPFCRGCDRSRLTADGVWFLCLYASSGVDLKDPLRAGATDTELAALIRATWSVRTDRGAEERASIPERTALYELQGLRADPHREMHTRGG